jgi:hypothetical protein
MFRMIERREQPCLALEPREAIGIGREARRQHLDRHIASELRIAGAVDFAHPAAAERRENLVRTETSTAR